MRIVHPVSGHWDVWAGLAATFLAVAAVFLPFPPVGRMIAVVPVVLLVPGYAVVTALFVGHALPRIEHLLFALGGNIAIVVIGGLLLSATPPGLHGRSWITLLAAVSSIGLGITLFRRLRGGIPGNALKWALPPLGGVEAVLLTVAAVTLVGTLLGVRFASGDRDAGVPAQLWILPADDGAAVTLGVRGGTVQDNYTVRVTTGGRVIHEANLSLGPGEIREISVVRPQDMLGESVAARLYQAGRVSELRSVVLRPSEEGDPVGIPND